MILGNYTALNSNPGRAIGNFTNLLSNYKPGGWYSFYDFDKETQSTEARKQACYPTGTQPHNSWILAPKGGELSSTTQINGTSSQTLALANGINIESDMAGSGTIASAGLSLVTSMIATLTGTGALTASMVGTIQMAASLAGSGNITASLKMLTGLTATLAGIGAISSDLKGKLFMEADIYVNQSQATVDQIVEGVVDNIGSITATVPNMLNTETGDIIIPLD